MSTFDTLPVVLVSAINETAATLLISELIDNDVTGDYLKESQSRDRVWRLVNKYYTVNIRVHALTDHGRLEVDPDAIEAHVIHITQEELSNESLMLARAEARAAGGAGAWRRCGVRLLLADCGAEPAALSAWAGAQHADAVALRESAENACAPFADQCGLERVRAALHAHVWRGLVRTDRAARPLPPDVSLGSEGSSGSDGSDGSDSEAEELRAVEQAEAFAAALGALGPALAARNVPDPALAARHVPGPALPDMRRERAEALVHAFCRALGLDRDTC